MLLSTFRLENSEKIISIDISEKEDYLLVVYKLTDSDHSLIKIWEILNNKGIVESALTEDIVDAKWNKDGLSTHEFVTLT